MVLNFVTTNENKFHECKNILSVPVKQISIELLEIQTDKLKEVAKAKIENALQKNVKPPFFIEDAGFFIKGLKGFPGVYSSYIQKTIGNLGVLNILKEVEDRTAYFECVVAYLENYDKPPLFFTGTVYGTVSYEIRGQKGFGFDPIFLPNTHPTITFGEMETEEKNKISHRAQALWKFATYLRER